MAGMRELAKLRRAGLRRAAKHPPTVQARGADAVHKCCRFLFFPVDPRPPGGCLRRRCGCRYPSSPAGVPGPYPSVGPPWTPREGSTGRPRSEQPQSERRAAQRTPHTTENNGSAAAAACDRAWRRGGRGRHNMSHGQASARSRRRPSAHKKASCYSGSQVTSLLRRPPLLRSSPSSSAAAPSPVRPPPLHRAASLLLLPHAQTAAACPRPSRRETRTPRRARLPRRVPGLGLRDGRAPPRRCRLRPPRGEKRGAEKRPPAAGAVSLPLSVAPPRLLLCALSPSAGCLCLPRRSRSGSSGGRARRTWSARRGPSAGGTWFGARRWRRRCRAAGTSFGGARWRRRWPRMGGVGALCPSGCLWRGSRCVGTRRPPIRPPARCTRPTHTFLRQRMD